MKKVPSKHQWSNDRLGISRLIWSLVFAVAGGTFLYSLPTYYQMLMTPCTGDYCLPMQPPEAFAQAMARLGWPLQWFAAWNVLIVTTLALSYGAFAVLLLWRRSTERSVWLFSLILLLIGTFLPAAVDVLGIIHEFWFYFINFMNSIMWISLVLLFYIFPDGRFVPAWSWLGMLPLVALRASLFLPLSFPIAIENWPSFVEPILVSIIFGICIFAQVYRYWYVSTPLQRQQTKWIVFGLVLMAVQLLIISLGLEPHLTDSASPTMHVLVSVAMGFLWLIIFLTLPITVTIAILRYRLWDIDLLIRRTLIYATLTISLALLYFGCVVFLQLLMWQVPIVSQSYLVTVVSTLIVAALFAPLRERVQLEINQRFYRVRILFLAANPLNTDRLRLDEEVRTIDETLHLAEFRNRFDLVQHWAVRFSDVDDYLLRHTPHIVHFAGHGSAAGEIVLEDATGQPQSVPPAALTQLFHILKDNVRCVVLNGCFSFLQAEAIAQEVDCVIGMTAQISDNAAIYFASGFYRGLGNGHDVQAAFELGCREIIEFNLDDRAKPQLLVKPNTNVTTIVFV
jgi:hypothetical protein